MHVLQSALPEPGKPLVLSAAVRACLCACAWCPIMRACVSWCAKERCDVVLPLVGVRPAFLPPPIMRTALGCGTAPLRHRRWTPRPQTRPQG